MASGLVDEYRLLVHPVILGQGLPLFSDLLQPIRLHLMATSVFKSGEVAGVPPELSSAGTCAWRIIKSAEWRDFEVLIRLPGMRDFLILFVHLIVTVVRLAGPGGLRSVVAESALVRYQLLILNRGRKRAPNLRPTDRIIAGLCTLFMRRARTLRSAIVLKASTLLQLHAVLCKRKYRTLFSPQRRHRPGPKGPKKDLIDAVVATKRRNPKWGCPRIAQQIALAFGIEIDKDVVRRILSVHYRP